MLIIGSKKSYDESQNRDCFGNSAPSSVDHIWPISDGGSNIKENKMRLAKISNQAKANKTKGKINRWRFALLKQVTKNDEIYGKMIIQNEDQENKKHWYEVEPIL